ncbi:type IV pilus modification protein PilV [Acinetobacter wuhouensis]|uniref:Type IV pilus modification protein PilV n=1 Tax=Acinetobacter wuhouensis TaxID=1879050 RepID=A0A3G2T8A6_9GAMM|nr:type IV pilus modification protein PilV [Acinetobacter wuhouensis]AYO55816.1 type IV pilus modification protein PilV [Acinetobacter wuhouensis]
MSIKKQKGVGLIEVLVALLLLAIGVLGFSLLQLRAMDATQEATERTASMNIARDLAERIRINRTQLAEYKKAINGTPITIDCMSKANFASCTTVNMANYDAQQILDKAKSGGQTILMSNCKKSESLSCIYVSWGKTDIKKSLSNCVEDTGTYVVDSKCLVMEAY